MREAELRVIDCLRDRSYSVGELADAIDSSQSWTSEVVADLENDHLVDRADGVQLPTTYEATLLAELLDRYALENVLTGTKEDILRALLGGPKTISELQQQGFAKSTLYKHLNEIQETGAIAHTDDGYVRYPRLKSWACFSGGPTASAI